MTFKELQDDVLERTTFDASQASSSARTRIKRFLNEIYRRACRETGMSRMLTGTTTIATVADQADYSVTAAGVKAIYSPDSGRVLQELTLPQLRDLDPTSATSSVPYAYAISKVGATTVTVTLFPVPSAELTLNVDTEGALTALSADGDIPVLPIDFHYLLSAGARMLESERMQKWDNHQAAKFDYEAGLRKLRLHLAKSARRSNVVNPTVKTSRLGPWFEANS